MHFAQVAFALIAGGAAVLIVAGLVLEALHDKTRPTTPFVDSSDSAARAVNADTMRQSRDKRTVNERLEAARTQREKRHANLSDEERRTKREERKRRRAAKRNQAAVPAEASGG